jgi:hypothetical protein
MYGVGVVALAAATVHIYSSSIAASQNKDHVELTVAIAQNSKLIDLAKIDCLSTVRDRAEIFEKSNFDNPDIVGLIQQQIPGKRITVDDVNCPFGIGFTIIKGAVRAIWYQGQSAEVLMSFYVCTRKPDGAFNASPCLSKNSYLFTNKITPLQAFSLGLQALVRGQDTEWVVIKLSAALTPH